MAAIITDQIRILNARNFLAGVTSTTNSYYSFEYDNWWEVKI